MPESPEVQVLAEFLADRLVGRTVEDVDVIEFRSVKTRGRSPETLRGAQVTGAERFGKHVDLRLGDQHLLVTLGRHGWIRLRERGESAGTDPEAPPALATLALDDGAVIEATDAGDWVSLGLSVVDSPTDVAAVAKLGPDPASPDFGRDAFDRAVRGRRKQIKAILQEQESLSGIGNAYSDEILHAAKVSPVAHAATLDDDALDRVFTETVETVRGAIAARRGIPIDQLKAAKVAAMRVHGRAGETCPVCGDTIRDFRFGGTTAEYCPTCQTAGVEL
ncbi:DNA-formamidopyrimidine glycosylase family protein [Microbacterium sp. BK668]|uniref:DNA-formamidopyrimidine glycosylase family protein n=1 Tax=Microbacterium sp. BK668 TaxID=2512118 RepID=UPI00105CF535|nr:DNA-formamidopyrimidine glycosylase family protein [Microbacterium sp. BK668]TDN92452.1 DNA-(apurinic or apyrimidinic site) lyase [Microbacterium sp. BK668]